MCCKQDAISGSWHSHQLYVTTPSSVHCVMVAGHADAKEVHIEVSVLSQSPYDMCFILPFQPSPEPDVHVNTLAGVPVTASSSPGSSFKLCLVKTLSDPRL